MECQGRVLKVPQVITQGIFSGFRASSSDLHPSEAVVKDICLAGQNVLET